MSLPEPILDDLRFQSDLVDEARRRIIRYCPEWTEYNLSDPGITLVELFAWMTEMITYRMNLVPEKNRVKFMEMMGISLKPATSARTELTFRLTTVLPINPDDDTTVLVPKGTEVSTRPAGQEAEVIFTTDQELIVVPPRLVQVRRDADFNKNYQPRLGVEVFHAFGHPRPKDGDTFYLGFDESRDISGHILRLDFTAEETQATGVRRSDPPWVWEASVGNDQWLEVPVSSRPGERDTTGGLNNPEGSLVLYLPLNARPDVVHGRTAYWVRCRLEQRRPEQGMYSQSPRVLDVRAFAIGATTPATHATIEYEEMLGRSSGEPGQTFQLEHRPVLALDEDEYVEVEEMRDGELVFVPWEYVEEFSNSTRYDRHFSLDTAAGTVEFGPSVRQRDGSMRQYGRVPEPHRNVRIRKYRHGGGGAGNVPANRINQMRSAIPYILEVTNLKRAEGGRDQENLEEATFRARREIRSQERAVTAEDYQDLVMGASRSVARVKCRAPGGDPNVPPGMIELLIVPAVYESVRQGDLAQLALTPELMKTVEQHVDKYRLLTTTLRVREPTYLGVQVVAEIVAGEYVDPDTVRERVAAQLREFIAPLVMPDGDDDSRDDLLGPDWDGWPFGRALFVSELFALIQRVPGVQHVLDVSLRTRPVVPAKEKRRDNTDEVGEASEQDESELTPVGDRKLAVPPDALLCSLDHEIRLAEL